EQPTVAAFAVSVGEALKLKSQLAPTPPIRPIPRSGELPLSFAQQRLWFLDQWEPSSPFYNSPSVLRLSGRLELAVLQRTLFEVVRRHEVLRTSFPSMNGNPRQRIVESWQPLLPLIDLSALDQGAGEEVARRLAQREALQPFDLATGPLLRATVLRLSAEDHVLLFTLHHIVSDGWSMGLLVREVAALYKAYQEGQESPLEELAVQYADYAVWQREWLAGEVLEGQLEYWRRQLAGAPPMLELPADRPRPRVQSYRGAAAGFRLNGELTAGLKELSRRSGVTLFMTLLAGFEVLLWRLSGQEDICVGTAIANRTRRETEGLIGFFVNTLVLRVEVNGEMSSRELLGRVREVCLGAYGHQEVPFERLVEELRPERSLNHSPLFQVAFGLDNAPREELQLPGLKLSGMESENEVVRFDLTLWMTELAGELSGRWMYRTELFDAERVQRMSRQLERLLENMVANPEARIETLEMFTEAEKEQKAIEGKVRGQANYQKLLSVKPKPIRRTG
ncbi:MAG TPA: condensation domain-containing protein, partial [Pyrinomonadaceae bacterium]